MGVQAVPPWTVVGTYGQCSFLAMDATGHPWRVEWALASGCSEQPRPIGWRHHASNRAFYAFEPGARWPIGRPVEAGPEVALAVAVALLELGDLDGAHLVPSGVVEHATPRVAWAHSVRGFDEDRRPDHALACVPPEMLVGGERCHVGRAGLLAMSFLGPFRTHPRRDRYEASVERRLEPVPDRVGEFFQQLVVWDPRERPSAEAALAMAPPHDPEALRDWARANVGDDGPWGSVPIGPSVRVDSVEEWRALQRVVHLSNRA